MPEKYLFTHGSQQWFYTSGYKDEVYGADTYVGSAVGRSDISFDIDKQEATIKMPLSLQPAPMFLAFNPSSVIWITIRNDANNVIFIGRIASCSFDVDKQLATVKAISIQAMLRGKVPTRTYSQECSHELFDSGCGLSGPTWAILLNTSDATLSADRIQITHTQIGSQSDGYWTGGYVTLSFETSYIIAHSGNTITLLFPLLLWSSDMALTIYPGCSKELSVCQSKYSNVINYGGFPFIPRQNVMTQGF